MSQFLAKDVFNTGVVFSQHHTSVSYVVSLVFPLRHAASLQLQFNGNETPDEVGGAQHKAQTGSALAKPQPPDHRLSPRV